MMSSPKVRVVVLNFDGGQMTLDCIQSLAATDWPPDALEIVMVDNGSLDDVVERVRASFPKVRILEPLANLGFAGGCNLGMTTPPVGGFEPEMVALVNNDATVDPSWLRSLSSALVASSDIGAVSAKMLFADRVRGLEFEIRGPGEAAQMCLTGLRVEGRRNDARFSFDEGVFGPTGYDARSGDEMCRWTAASGSIRVVDDDSSEPTRIELRLSSHHACSVVIRTDTGESEHLLDETPQWIEVSLPPIAFDVINNVGSNLYAAGFGGDRGFLERDRGQYEDPAEVFAWCGGAVLLRREYLESVGKFDERLFLYYEDTDLSWRGRLAGWRYVYEPKAVVRHRHAQSSGVGSPVFRFHTERNRLLVLAKCAPARLAWRAGLGELRRMTLRNLRDLVLRPLVLKFPIRDEARHRRRVFFSYVSLLPGVIRDRWLLDVRVSRRELMKWQVTK